MKQSSICSQVVGHWRTFCLAKQFWNSISSVLHIKRAMFGDSVLKKTRSCSLGLGKQKGSQNQAVGWSGRYHKDMTSSVLNTGPHCKFLLWTFFFFFCVPGHARFSVSKAKSAVCRSVSTGPQSFLWASTGLGHVWRLKSSKDKPLSFTCVRCERRDKPLLFTCVRCEGRDKPLLFTCVRCERRDKPLLFTCVRCEGRDKPLLFTCVRCEGRDKPLSFTCVRCEGRDKPLSFTCVRCEGRDKPLLCSALSFCLSSLCYFSFSEGARRAKVRESGWKCVWGEGGGGGGGQGNAEGAPSEACKFVLFTNNSLLCPLFFLYPAVSGDPLGDRRT